MVRSLLLVLAAAPVFVACDVPGWSVGGPFADIVEVSETFVIPAASALTIDAPTTRAFDVDGRGPEEQTPSGFFIEAETIAGTDADTAIVHAVVHVERAAADEVTFSLEDGAIRVSCDQAWNAGAQCWASLFAWVPENVPLTIRALSMEDGVIAGMRGSLDIDVGEVEYFAVDHDADATIGIENVTENGQVDICIRGESILAIGDGTPALLCGL